MADVVLFRSRADLGAEANLRDFIALCRNRLTVFGADLAFDDLAWDVTDALALKAKSGVSRAVFSTWASSAAEIPAAMPEPFGSFAKSYFRYQYGARPTKSIGPRLAALRVVEAALTENGAAGDPCRMYAGVFDRAAQLAKDRFSAAVAYRVGIQLEMLARFVTDHRLTSIPVRWRNPIKRPQSHVDRVGEEFDRRRQQKLPSARALDALAAAFRAAEDPADVLVSSVAAVLCSAPERINEVLHLHVDCEVSARRAGKDVYGLRWWPAKGADPQVKWLIPSMADVVREALARIRKHTDEARRISRWYEQHPQSLYLPRHLGHLRTQEMLSMAEVAEVLFVGRARRGTPLAWCGWHDVAPVAKGGRMFARFADVERAVLRLLPRGFPTLNAERGLKYSEALCVIQRNLLHASKATYRCLIEPINHGTIHTRLGGRSTWGFRSIFDRLGLCEVDGSPIRITTQQFRHYLNTLAQAGGMSQLDIAKWSGRSDIRQNAAYDHVSDQSMLVKLREAIGDERRFHGPLARLPHTVPIPRDDFARLAIPAVHTTEVGFCVHDFVMSPCALHRACFQCEELICVKGDARKEAEIRRLCTETRGLLARAEEAADEQHAGANRWIEHQRETLKRLDQLCAILDDPSVPTGTFIQLSQSTVAHRLQSRSHAAALEQRSTPPGGQS
jgi:hypothetical protein